MILAQRLMIATDGQADRIIAAMTTQPDATRVGIIRTAVQQIKDAGVWNKLDGLFMLAAHDNQAGRVNWINPGFVAPIAGTVTFTTDRGFTPNGAGGSYVNANGVPIVRRTLTSGCLGVRVSGTSLSGSNQSDAGQGAGFSLTMSNTPGTRAVVTLDSSSVTSTGTVGGTSRHVVATKTGTTLDIYTGLTSMTSIASQTVTNAGVISNSPFFGSSDNTSSSTRRFSCGYFGGYLTSGEITALNNAIQAYHTAIGSP